MNIAYFIRMILSMTLAGHLWRSTTPDSSIASTLPASTKTLFRSGMLCSLLFTSFPGISASGLHAHTIEESVQEKHPKAGLLRHTTWDDMLPHTLQGSFYNEFWAYHVFLENNLQIHLTFSLANFGAFKGAVSGGKLMVSNFNNQNYHVFREFGLEHLHIDPEAHKIRLHAERDIWLEGRLPETHRIFFSTTKNEVSYHIDLQFENIHAGYTVDEGVYQLDGESLGIFIHIPRASVHGTVAINQDTLSVRGTAYMDHTFQTNLSSRVVKKGFRYISHTEEEGFITGYYLIPRKRMGVEWIGFTLEHTPDNSRYESVQIWQPYELEVIQSSMIGGNKVPEKIAFLSHSGKQYILERQMDYQSVSFLEEVSGLRRRLVRNFLGGEVIEYVGLGKFGGQLPVYYNFLMVH